MEFDKYDGLVGVPLEAINDCSHSGDCADDVAHWVSELQVTSLVAANRKGVEAYLQEYGAWDDLKVADDATLALRLLWIVCGNIKDEMRFGTYYIS